MSRVRGKDTTPEKRVRKALTGIGLRYRLHARDLPGKPDIVFRGKRKAIFVHGCFWHGHKGCPRSKLPDTNVDFWREKIAKNKKRDAAALGKLEASGWSVLVVWECKTKDGEALVRLLSDFMEG